MREQGDLQPCPVELQKPFHANELVHTLQRVSMQRPHVLTPGEHCRCGSFEVTRSSMGTSLTHTPDPDVASGVKARMRHTPKTVRLWWDPPPVRVCCGNRSQSASTDDVAQT